VSALFHWAMHAFPTARAAANAPARNVSVDQACASRAAGSARNAELGAPRLGWSNRRFGVAAAATRTENDLTLSAGAGAFDDRIIGGIADLGTVRVSLAYRVFEYATSRQKNTLAGLWVPLGRLELKASVVRVAFDGVASGTSLDGNGALQIAAGFVYTLLKRSALYGTVARLDNRGASTFLVGSRVSGDVVTPGSRSSGTEIGFRHDF
jgi:hypothetical protein